MSENYVLLVVVVVTLIEAIVETIKPIYDKEKGWNKDALIALGVSVLVCALGNLDLFSLAGFPLMVPIVGSVLTGFIASRGTNVVHDLLTIIKGLPVAIRMK
jgi:hypothetical protein